MPVAISSTSKNEDVVPEPESYPYLWDKESSDTPLKDFLAKYKPSMVQDDGTKPWLWVRKSAPEKKDTGADAATEEANELLREITERVESIQNDDSIPVRANKKKGLKSKKELREEIQREASEKLKDISTKHGFVSGKWLVFAPADKVDVIWNSIATSLIEGPLASTCAYLTKVATSPRDERPNYQHVLCLYIPDVYDKDSVTEVMKVLLRRHGVNLSGVKSNLYTAIGLDSKHPSGIQSTVWKNAALMRDTDMKALKDEYFAERDATKAADAGRAAAENADSANEAASGASKPAKPKLRKKAANDDPFASEDDAAGPHAPQAPAARSAGSTKAPLRKKPKAEAAFVDDEDDEDEKAAEEQRRKEIQAKKMSAKATTGKRTSPDSDDEEAEERPRKTLKRGGKK